MNCKESRANLIEFARSGLSGSPLDSALAVHLEVCVECLRFADGQSALHAALASMAAQTVAGSAPEDLEARLLAEFDAAARTGSRQVRGWFPALAVALAVCLIAALLMRRSTPGPQSASPAGEEPFLQIPYVTPRAPYERAAVMRMQVPLTALIAAGFEVHTTDIGAAVSADVLVGQDGRALAIRLVPSSIPNSDRRLNQ
jgi:hypothetical protein